MTLDRGLKVIGHVTQDGDSRVHRRVETEDTKTRNLGPGTLWATQNVTHEIDSTHGSGDMSHGDCWAPGTRRSTQILKIQTMNLGTQRT